MKNIIKQCTKCKQKKEATEFVKDKNRKDGINSWCKQCMYQQRREKEYDKKDRQLNKEKWTRYRRKCYIKRKNEMGDVFYQRKFNYKLKHVFKTTREWFDEQYKKQGGRCAICLTIILQRQNLSIDHCHNTGLVRGLLCGNCNTGIGQFKENPEIMKSAIKYLLLYNKK